MTLATRPSDDRGHGKNVAFPIDGRQWLVMTGTDIGEQLKHPQPAYKN